MKKTLAKQKEQHRIVREWQGENTSPHISCSPKDDLTTGGNISVSSSRNPISVQYQQGR